MKILCPFAVFSALCLTATGKPGPGNHSITCKTSGIVPEGTAADVTCDFHNDLDQVEGIIYALRNSSEEAVIIAICSWKEGHQACRLEDGFELKEATPDGKMTFEVPSAQERHSGHYKCKTLPARESSADSCTLTVQKNEIMANNPVACHTNSPVQPGEDASLLCMFPKSIGITGVTLEKYYSDKSDKEEIVRCNKDEDCTEHKAGYKVDQKTHSYLKVSIPHTTQDKAGVYFCRSTLIQQESGACSLSVSSGRKKANNPSLKQIIFPLYAILGCFLLLIVLGLVAVLQRSACAWYPRFHDKATRDSKELLMRKERPPIVKGIKS